MPRGKRQDLPRKTRRWIRGYDVAKSRRRSMPRSLVGLVALVAVLCGCSMSADTTVAEQAVPKFHEQLDAGQFDAIYDESADELKKATTQQDFVVLLAAIHRKLGNTKASDKTGWTVNYQTSGSFVTLGYKTTFDGGSAQEQFVFRLQDKAAVLVGYHINSTALILK
jgi:opacity protein-like surface antigen